VVKHKARQTLVMLSAQVLDGHTAVHTLEVLIANSAGILGQTGTQKRVEKSAKSRGD